MTLRRKKMEKVLELREQALQERAGALSVAHQGRAEAQEQVHTAANCLAQAAEYRSNLANGAFNVGAWIDAEQWLAQRTQQHSAAQVQLRGAEERVSQAYTNVLEARSDVKRIELLERRLTNHELRQERRSEQKNNDEFAQRRFAASRRLGTD
jgi:flagellar export protein FliJ